MNALRDSTAPCRGDSLPRYDDAKELLQAKLSPSLGISLPVRQVVAGGLWLVDDGQMYNINRTTDRLKGE